MAIEWLSKPIAIGKKTAPNRIVYQPTEANNCDSEGSATEHTMRKYAALARGRPGIIHIESSDVTTRTQARSNRLLILDHNMPGLEKLVKEIRKINSESLIVFQLSHAGRLSDPVFKPPMYVYRTNGSDRIMSIRGYRGDPGGVRVSGAPRVEGRGRRDGFQAGAQLHR